MQGVPTVPITNSHPGRELQHNIARSILPEERLEMLFSRSEVAGNVQISLLNCLLPSRPCRAHFFHVNWPLSSSNGLPNLTGLAVGLSVQVRWLVFCINQSASDTFLPAGPSGHPLESRVVSSAMYLESTRYRHSPPHPLQPPAVHPNGR